MSDPTKMSTKKFIKPIIIKKESLQKLVFTNNSFSTAAPSFIFANQSIKSEPVELERVKTETTAASQAELIIPDGLSLNDTNDRKFVILNTNAETSPNKNIIKAQGHLNFFTATKDGKKIIYIKKADSPVKIAPKKPETQIKDFKVTSSALKNVKKQKKEKQPIRHPPPLRPKVTIQWSPLPRTPKIVTLEDVKSKSQMQNVYIPIKPSTKTPKAQAVHIPVKNSAWNKEKEAQIVSEDIKIETPQEELLEEILEEAGCEVTVSTEDENKMELGGELYQEIATEEPITAYECSECHMQYDTEEEITAHLEEGHTFSYECTQCNHQTFDAEEARSHFRDAHQMELVLGDEEEEEVVEHVEPKEPWAEEDFVASVVLLNQDEAAKEEGQQIEEVDDDEPKETLECHYCFKTFYSRKTLDAHITKHQVDQTAALDNLSKENPSCDECSMSFENNKEWTKHILTSRRHKDMKRMILNGCRHCGEIFRSPNDFREHLKEAHPEKAVKRGWPNPQPCNICGLMIPDAHKFWGHYKKEHPNETYPRSQPCKYKCDECGSQFRCRSLLKLHMNKHLGLRLFHCPECPKTFYTALSLKYHQIAHSEIRPFKCQTCGRGFKFKAAMERHQLVHTGERPYVCGVCGQGFTTMHWTQLHVRKVHNNEYIPYKPRVRKRRAKQKKSSSDEDNPRVSGTMDADSP